MKIFNSIYLNSFSLGSLIAVIFFFSSAFFLLTIKNRSKASTVVGLSFALLGVFNIGYIISSTVYHPLAAYHRWWTISIILIALSVNTIFYFNYPTERNPRISKLLFSILFVISMSFFIIFAITSLSADKVFIFHGHYWDFDSDNISKKIAYMIFTFTIINTILCLWRFITHHGQERWNVLILGFIYIVATVGAAVANFLSRDGLISRELFQNIWVISNVGGFFIYIVYYINNAKERISFMVKIIGISIVTFLTMLQVVSYYLLMEKDESYDELNNKTVSIVINSPNKGEDTRYLVYYNADENQIKYISGLESIYFKESNPDFQNALIWEKIRKMDNTGFKSELANILKTSPEYFSGYKNAIIEFSKQITNINKSPVQRLLDDIDSIRKDVNYCSIKIKQMPNDNFRFSISTFINNRNEKVSTFYDAVRKHLKKHSAEGKILKKEILEYFTVLTRPESRHYRMSNDGKEHFIGYMQVDLSANKVFEVGFPYLDYRAYMHKTVLKFVIILFCMIFIILLGYQLFFWGILVKPLKTLSHGIMEVDDGNLDIKIPIIVDDEIGFLSRNFNKMVATIKDSKIEIDNYTKNLESMVEHRTEELKQANLNLSQTNERLTELDKLKTNFLANISHEIRTPLTLILAPIESVIQGDYNKSIDNIFFENIQKNAIRLLRLINNLLDFSKIEAGRMNLRVQEIDMVPIIKNYLDTVWSSAESKGVTLNFISKKDSVKIFADIEKIDRIAMNVFSNALKFTEKGGKIEIRVTDDEQNCYVEIEDTGIGIPSDKLDTIFDRFSQVDSSSSRQFEGTGIGLSLARELLDLHCGSISVASRYIDDHPGDHGTVFTITFPKYKKHLEDRTDVEFVDGDDLEQMIIDRRRFVGVREMIDLKESKTTSNPGHDILNDSIHNAGVLNRVLIVEDNPDMREFLKTLIQDQYTVSVAVDGRDGFDTAMKIKPDLIITDVMMPNIDGYTMTRMLKEDASLKRIPVLMLTARADLAHKIEGLEFGADDYVTKPFNSKELLARIRSLLKTREYEKAIENRQEEIGHELKIARLLQQKLLPDRSPEISGYRSDVVYIPMDMVGGDFYDFKLKDKIIELFIADVSGHGLPGAFISMITKMAFESIGDRVSTKNVLYLLNDVICRSTVENNYVTVFYCIINRETNVMSYSNAGHFPPLIYRQDSHEFIELQAKGTPLGWFKNVPIEEKTIQLNTGDRLFLYTDGITECANPEGTQFDENGFKEFIIANTKISPEKFTEGLLAHLRDFSGREKFDDDLCLMVFDVM